MQFWAGTPFMKTSEILAMARMGPMAAVTSQLRFSNAVDIAPVRPASARRAHRRLAPLTAWFLPVCDKASAVTITPSGRGVIWPIAVRLKRWMRWT